MGGLCSLAQPEEFLRRYGHISVGIGVGFRTSTNPNNDGLLGSWSRSGSHTEKDRARQLRRRFEAQTSAGTAPTLTHRELSAHVRNGDLPHDAYTFAPVDDTALANVSELHQLWRMLGDIEARDDDHAMGTLFGLGGRNSGIMFHRHMSAVSALFAGHKRWLIYDDALHAPDRAFLNRQMQEAQRRDPKFRLDSIESWSAHILPLPDVQAWWHARGEIACSEPETCCTSRKTCTTPRSTWTKPCRCRSKPVVSQDSALVKT